MQTKNLYVVSIILLLSTGPMLGMNKALDLMDKNKKNLLSTGIGWGLGFGTKYLYDTIRNKGNDQKKMVEEYSQALCAFTGKKESPTEGTILDTLNTFLKNKVDAAKTKERQGIIKLFGRNKTKLTNDRFFYESRKDLVTFRSMCQHLFKTENPNELQQKLNEKYILMTKEGRTARIAKIDYDKALDRVKQLHKEQLKNERKDTKKLYLENLNNLTNNNTKLKQELRNFQQPKQNISGQRREVKNKVSVVDTLAQKKKNISQANKYQADEDPYAWGWCNLL